MTTPNESAAAMPPYDHEAAMQILDAMNDPDWEANREPTVTYRVVWELDIHDDVSSAERIVREAVPAADPCITGRRLISVSEVNR